MQFIGNIEADAQVRAVASGALATGDAVVVNSDGTVSVVALSAVPQAVGTPTVFESSQTTHVSATFDPNSNKVVISYQDVLNSSFGTAVVGTVSGTSISFGTPVVFASTYCQYMASTFDSNSNKVVVAYRDVDFSAWGTAVVGTVSGTSISFGTPAVFNTAATLAIACSFDTTANKVVIAYRNVGNSSFGTAVVATVSGTSISFGTPVVYESATALFNSCAYDSNVNRTVISYVDDGNLTRGTAVVGTVSGTSISFGTPVVFKAATVDAFTSTVFNTSTNKIIISYQSGGNGKCIVGTTSTGPDSISFGTEAVFSTPNADFGSAVFDSNANKVVISYRNLVDYHSYMAVGTISGTSISFGTPVLIDTSGLQYGSATFDSVSNKVVAAYRSGTDPTYYGTAVVFGPAYTGTNLTAENFVGFANSGYADGQSAAINSTCTVDSNQSGLTAGQAYYVQTNGTLSQTPAVPSVFAGTAVSTTNLIVKG